MSEIATDPFAPQVRTIKETQIIQVAGKDYMRDGKSNLVPVELVKPQDMLEDQLVRELHHFALLLSQQIARFKDHSFDDINSFSEVLAEKYGTTVGGPKGNKTFTSFDGKLRVKVQVADIIDFGPSLQVAKQLVDECLADWSSDSRPELRAIINRAFNVDKEGQINRAELLSLLRLDIDDTRWQRAMEALRDAIRIIGSKEYIRFYQRKKPQDKFQAITIDLAKV